MSKFKVGDLVFMELSEAIPMLLSLKKEENNKQLGIIILNDKNNNINGFQIKFFNLKHQPIRMWKDEENFISSFTSKNDIIKLIKHYEN
jgi:hypothetical protein